MTTRHRVDVSSSPDVGSRQGAEPAIGSDTAPAETESATGALSADVSPRAREALIAQKAYLRAEVRGFVHGYELEDWLAAEAEVDALLAAEHRAPPQ
jgi:DUF2934 family protein